MGRDTRGIPTDRDAAAQHAPAVIASRPVLCLSRPGCAADWEFDVDGRLVSSERRSAHHRRRAGHAALRAGTSPDCASGVRASPLSQTWVRSGRCTSTPRPGAITTSMPAGPDRRLSAVSPVSARRLSAAGQGRRFLCTDLAGEPRVGLGVSLHPVLLGHRQLAAPRSSAPSAPRPSSTGSAHAAATISTSARPRRVWLE